MKMKEIDFKSITVKELKQIFDRHGVKYEEGAIERMKENQKLVMVLRQTGPNGIFLETSVTTPIGNYDPTWEIDDKLTIEKVPALTCLRCEKKWLSMKEEKPKTCPNCRSPYWDTARREIQNELEHIRRGNIEQNMLRCYYQVLRSHHLKKNPERKKSDILQECVAAVKKSYPGFVAMYDKSFFLEQ
ncbi:MAG: hypothetical protein HY917_00565 [Candidatus Diapherotrites archaeon]|nr:hypothetical protein [Candidatus Diapherotrites archaeon]